MPLGLPYVIMAAALVAVAQPANSDTGEEDTASPPKTVKKKLRI